MTSHSTAALWLRGEGARTLRHIRPDIGTLRVDMPTGGHLEHLYADARRACRQHRCADVTPLSTRRSPTVK